MFINYIKLERQKLGSFRTDTKFWIYYMHQGVKKKIDTKIYCLLLYNADIIVLGLCNFMVVEYKIRIHQKTAIFEGFSGKFDVRNGHNIWR